METLLCLPLDEVAKKLRGQPAEQRESHQNEQWAEQLMQGTDVALDSITRVLREKERHRRPFQLFASRNRKMRVRRYPDQRKFYRPTFSFHKRSRSPFGHARVKEPQVRWIRGKRHVLTGASDGRHAQVRWLLTELRKLEDDDKVERHHAEQEWHQEEERLRHRHRQRELQRQHEVQQQLRQRDVLREQLRRHRATAQLEAEKLAQQAAEREAQIELQMELQLRRESQLEMLRQGSQLEIVRRETQRKGSEVRRRDIDARISPPASPSGYPTVKVSGIPIKYTSKDIMAAFRGHFDVHHVIKDAPGSALVLFKNVKDARKAKKQFDGGEMNDSKIKVTWVDDMQL